MVFQLTCTVGKKHLEGLGLCRLEILWWRDSILFGLLGTSPAAALPHSSLETSTSSCCVVPCPSLCFVGKVFGNFLLFGAPSLSSSLELSSSNLSLLLTLLTLLPGSGFVSKGKTRGKIKCHYHHHTKTCSTIVWLYTNIVKILH